MDWMILPLKRYADFKGRSRRMEFWLYTLFVVLLWIVLMAVIGTVFGVAMTGLGANASPDKLLASIGGGGFAAIGLIGIVWLALFIPGLAVSIRRMHDTNRSGWWAGAPVVLYYGSSFVRLAIGTMGDSATLIVSGLMSLGWLVTGIAFLVFACLEGTRGPNRFGPDPKNPESDLGEVFS